MKKIYILLGVIVLLVVIFIGIAMIIRVRDEKNAAQNIFTNPNRKCVNEPKRGYYPPKEKCCNGLESIFGSDGNWFQCQINELFLNRYMLGAPDCAPCGNNKCEEEYGENRCSCSEDCK